jgi:hypothetical protein
LEVAQEQEKDALAINMFRGGQGFASDVLEPLGTSRSAKVMEINTLAEQLVQELQELEKKIDMLIPDKMTTSQKKQITTQKQASSSERTLDFKGAMKKITDKLGKNKAEPSSEPEGELIGVGKDANDKE